MIFEVLCESAQKNELILIDGGYCRWHLCRNKQLTIYEIISIKPGAGSKMLAILRQKPASSIFARCPINLESNKWYKRRGFALEKTEETKSGRMINHWRLELCF